MRRRGPAPLYKGVLDRLVAAVLLVVLAPLIAIIALLVRLHLGSPVLFRQVRPGLHLRPFTMFKFRTMEPGDEGPESDDERLTRFGRLLRSFSLDELPELVNVLRGEMSFVGPRPLLMAYVPRYTPEQARRHDVMPGITGLAQVSGRNALDWAERFRLDIWYVDNWSVWLDLKILGLTLVKVLSREGISAAGHATMPEFMGSQGEDASAPARAAELVRVPVRAAAAVLTLQLSLAACVAVIDPYDLTQIVEIPRINAEKTQRAESGARTGKSLHLWLTEPDILILGGSRAWIGIDPAAPALASANAYNAAVPDATMVELHAIGSFALEHNRPRHVIIALEFSMFEADRTVQRDFADSGFGGDSMLLVYARAFFTPEAVKDALQTVQSNLRGDEAQNRDDGYHWRRRPLGNYRQAFTDVLRNDYLVQPWYYANFEYDPQRVRLLGDLASKFAARGTRVSILTSPVHARQLEAVYATQLYPTMERWLGDLTAMVAAVNARPETRTPVRLWSFTGYSPITTEDVPDPGDPETCMEWYWNSSLFKPATGNLMLTKIMGADEAAPAEFGVPLDPQSLPGYLAAQREARAAYLADHPEEVSDVGRLVLSTLAERTAAQLRDRG